MKITEKISRVKGIPPLLNKELDIYCVKKNNLAANIFRRKSELER